MNSSGSRALSATTPADDPPSILRCPHCRSPLLRSDRVYRCAHGHAFDVAKQGYVNLLPSSRRHSRRPGDNRDMILARRRFLDHGHFDRIADEVNRRATQLLAERSPARGRHVLDAGAGEGFYLARLKAHVALARAGIVAGWYGVDISRIGMQYATHRARDITWLVASLVDMPIADAAIDLLLSVFAPVVATEFRRLLRPDGALIVVEPGPTHLYELRRLLYADVLPQDAERLRETLAGTFSLQSESSVRYPITLPTATIIGDLLTMTPFGWNVDAETRARVEGSAPLHTSVEALVRVWRRG